MKKKSKEFLFSVTFSVLILLLLGISLKNIKCRYIPNFEPNERIEKLLINYDNDIQLAFAAGRKGIGYINAFNYRDSIFLIIWEVENTDSISISEISNKHQNQNINQSRTYSEISIGDFASINIEYEPCLNFQKQIYFLTDDYQAIQYSSSDIYELNGCFKKYSIIDNEDDLKVEMKAFKQPKSSYIRILSQNEKLYFITVFYFSEEIDLKLLIDNSSIVLPKL